MRVLVIKTSPLSEIIDALPVLDYLHQAVPEVEIDWVVEESLAEVLEGNPLLAHLHTVGSTRWRSLPHALETVREISALKETLGEGDYKFVFDLDGTVNSGLLSRLAGAYDRIGFERRDVAQRGNLLFPMRRVPLRRQDTHLTDKCLRLVSVPFPKAFQHMELGCTVITLPEDDLAAEALLATLSDGLVFLLECGGDEQTRLWTQQGWVALGRQLADSFSDSTILLPWAGEAEKGLVTEVAKSVPGARVIERRSVKGLAALLKRVDLVIGADNDTVHLAAALGTPTVSFYRATDGRQSGPRGERHVVVQSPIHCTRCFRTRCDKDAHCRATIKSEALLAGVVKLFKGGPHGQ